MPDIEKCIDQTGKSNFDRIYGEPDPREYFRILVGLDYIIPDLAKVVFRTLIKNLGRCRNAPLTVVDIGSSYGINSAVINHSLDVRRLAHRYADPEIYSLSSEELVELDRHYFASWPRLSDARFIGVDTSVPAVSYAQAVGLLDGAITKNLERSEPSEPERRMLADADLVISTGCVGYVTAKTFARILDSHRFEAPPTVACFALRMYPYDEIGAELAKYGLITEKLEGITFVQRRFDSPRECSSAMAALGALGLDSRGKESDGLMHAELYVSRTREEIKECPLGELVSVTIGESATRGRRFMWGENGHTEFVR